MRNNCCKRVSHAEEGSSHGAESRSSPHADKIRLFGLDFDDLTQAELIERISESVRERRRCWIATVNVNLVCHSARGSRVSRAPAVGGRSHRGRDADRLGLATSRDRPLRERVTGADLLKPLAARAASESWRIFLCGGEPGVAERTAEALSAFAPGVQMVGTASPDLPDQRIHGRSRVQPRAARSDSARPTRCPARGLRHAEAGAVDPPSRLDASSSMTCRSWSASAPRSTSWRGARSERRSGCAEWVSSGRTG